MLHLPGRLAENPPDDVDRDKEGKQRALVDGELDDDAAVISAQQNKEDGLCGDPATQTRVAKADVQEQAVPSKADAIPQTTSKFNPLGRFLLLFPSNSTNRDERMDGWMDGLQAQQTNPPTQMMRLAHR